MTIRFRFPVATAAASIAAASITMLLFASGCGECSIPGGGGAATASNSHDHEHGDAPASFGEAVDKLVGMRNQVRDAFAAKDIDAAHEPLHEVGHLLEAVPALAAKLSPAPDAATVKSAVDQLFDLFGKIDAKIHDGEEAAYSEFATDIDAAVASLQGLLLAAGATPSAEEAKHE